MLSLCVMDLDGIAREGTQAFEMRCYRRLLNISYKDPVTIKDVPRMIQAAIGVYDELLSSAKKRKLRWYGHISMSSGLAKTILQGTVQGKKKKGRQKKRGGKTILRCGQGWTMLAH